MSESAPRRPSAAGRFASQTEQLCAVAEKYAQQTDLSAEFPLAVLDELRAGGLLGLMVPTEYGGMGGTLDELLDVSIALGRTDLSAAMIFAMHCQQVACVVTHAAPPLAEELLPQIAAGRMYLASVTTEPGKGGHLLTAGAQLSADEAGEAKSGRLTFERFAPVVTGGAYADGFLISVRAPGARSANAVSLVFARRNQLEITASGKWDPLGMRASHSVALRLTGSIPSHQVIGQHGEFRAVVLQTLGPLAHLGWSACWLGTAAGALSRVLRMLRESARDKDGRLESELLLSRLSQARQRLDTVHALLRHTTVVVTAGAEGSIDISLPRNQLLINSLKLTASDQCHRAVEDLIDAVGMRHGYLRNSPTRLERALRDLRSAPLNYSNDRLHQVDGVLALLDSGVSFA